MSAAGANLRVVRVSNWPFGKHWAWMFVPVAETLFDPAVTKVIWKPRLPKPKLTKAEVQQFVRKYAATVQRLGPSYAPDEKTVAQLFAATVFGSTSAARLFHSMRRDVNLDGATAEVYEMAIADFAVGRPPNSSRCTGLRAARCCVASALAFRVRLEAGEL
jgi:hypothetical protein